MADRPPDRRRRSRTRPWLRGYVILIGLFLIAWVVQPVPDRAATPAPADQLVPIAIFTLPATLVMGALFAFVPPQHLLFRTALLAPFALYVAAAAGLFTFLTGDPGCGTLGAPCDTTAVARVVGLAGQSAFWFAGRGAEEITATVRRLRASGRG